MTPFRHSASPCVAPRTSIHSAHYREYTDKTNIGAHIIAVELTVHIEAHECFLSFRVAVMAARQLQNQSSSFEGRLWPLDQIVSNSTD